MISEPLNTRTDPAAFSVRIILSCCIPPRGHLENPSLKTPFMQLIASTFLDTGEITSEISHWGKASLAGTDNIDVLSS